VKKALVNAFLRGDAATSFNTDNLEQNYQLHLNVERIRVPESWFQPNMWGVDSAGIGEISGWILNSFEEEERRRLMQVSPSL
jgi:actin-related protein 5